MKNKIKKIRTKKITKNQWFNICYWTISGLIIWVILFIFAYFLAKKTTKDSLTIASVVILCFTLLAILLKLGLFERTILRYRNSKWNFTSRNDILNYQKKSLTMKNYHQILRHRLWFPLLINLMIYLSLLIIAIFI